MPEQANDARQRFNVCLLDEKGNRQKTPCYVLVYANYIRRVLPFLSSKHTLKRSLASFACSGVFQDNSVMSLISKKIC